VSAPSTATTLRTEGGEAIPLHLDRWRAEADEVERSLLGSVPGPVLDIGCGPGRLVAALAGTGRVALGIDPSPWAVAECQARGAVVLQRSVFDRLPGERRWGAALLFDGNIGIGGDPLRLLRRVAQLLRVGGQALVEVEPPGTPTRALVVRVESADGAPAGSPFRWARVGADGIESEAAAAGMLLCGRDNGGGRWFARLVKP
jgi:SAM-dependent methyltransferase